jgi:UDP-N-acetylglucosamine 2-epimerase (non-hydrolysing)
MLRVTNVVGARPNFMKIAPLMWEMAKRTDLFTPRLVHTGQHFDREMSAAFFDELGIPEPDVDLACGGGSHAEQTANIMVAFERDLLSHPADVIVVVGDVNSTMACAVVAKKLNLTVAHVEAGLRSGDMSMPEEINRKVTDAIADLLLTPSPDADENLLKEGVDPARIFFVGNTMIECLLAQLHKTEGRDTLRRFGVEPGQYGTVTLHRPSLVDHRTVLEPVLKVLYELSQQMPLVWPVHPRTRRELERTGLLTAILGIPTIKLSQPLGYLDMLTLNRNARLILTDSGGLQEEATVLGVPCLTLRTTTERPVTVSSGANIVVGTDPKRIRSEAKAILLGCRRNMTIPELWDGHVAARVSDVLISNVKPLRLEGRPQE